MPVERAAGDQKAHRQPRQWRGGRWRIRGSSVAIGRSVVRRGALTGATLRTDRAASRCSRCWPCGVLRRAEGEPATGSPRGHGVRIGTRRGDSRRAAAAPRGPSRTGRRWPMPLHSACSGSTRCCASGNQSVSSTGSVNSALTCWRLTAFRRATCVLSKRRSRTGSIRCEASSWDRGSSPQFIAAEPVHGIPVSTVAASSHRVVSGGASWGARRPRRAAPAARPGSAGVGGGARMVRGNPRSEAGSVPRAGRA